MKIKTCNIFPNGLALLWDDGSSSFIDYKNLRDSCPCAYCSGETDVFGNVYIGSGIKKIDLAYEVDKIETVGHYAIRIYWKDNHNSGIYPFGLLKQLDHDAQKD
tara:strand:+ start:444 stop:755 length:312 start_codon:yes stop_codon:yes gene_type:complete